MTTFQTTKAHGNTETFQSSLRLWRLAPGFGQSSFEGAWHLPGGPCHNQLQGLQIFQAFRKKHIWKYLCVYIYIIIYIYNYTYIYICIYNSRIRWVTFFLGILPLEAIAEFSICFYVILDDGMYTQPVCVCAYMHVYICGHNIIKLKKKKPTIRI